MFEVKQKYSRNQILFYSLFLTNVISLQERVWIFFTKKVYSSKTDLPTVLLIPKTS